MFSALPSLTQSLGNIRSLVASQSKEVGDSSTWINGLTLLSLTVCVKSIVIGSLVCLLIICHCFNFSGGKDNMVVRLSKKTSNLLLGYETKSSAPMCSFLGVGSLTSVFIFFGFLCSLSYFFLALFCYSFSSSSLLFLFHLLLFFLPFSFSSTSCTFSFPPKTIR